MYTAEVLSITVFLHTSLAADLFVYIRNAQDGIIVILDSNVC